MYFNIGNNIMINKVNLIGIFNYIEFLKTKEGKELYKELLEKKQVENNLIEEAKTIVIINKNNIVKAYLSKNVASTIIKRINN